MPGTWKRSWTGTDMFSLASSLPEDEITDRRTFAEESGGIVFLAVRRR